MHNISNCISALQLPNIIDKAKTYEIITAELFGIPPQKFSVTGAEVINKTEDYLQGATCEKIKLTCLISANKSYSFDIDIAYPSGCTNLPTFLHISFKRFEDSDTEIIKTVTDSGFMFVNVYYQDITTDDNDFNTGICACMDVDFTADARPGKICCWSMGLIAVVDYLCESPLVNKDYISVVGHSRLGKTALLTAAMDERIFFTVSNNSGAGGAALARGNTGEKVSDITKIFPFWFAINYQKYASAEKTMPFDQHYLLSLIAPRYLYVASAIDDAWACPKNEFLSAVCASEAYNRYGENGLMCETDIPTTPTVYHSGKIGYHLREGKHELLKYDWEMFIKFIKSKINS